VEFSFRWRLRSISTPHATQTLFSHLRSAFAVRGRQFPAKERCPPSAEDDFLSADGDFPSANALRCRRTTFSVSGCDFASANAVRRQRTMISCRQTTFSVSGQRFPVGERRFPSADDVRYSKNAKKRCFFHFFVGKPRNEAEESPSE